VKIDIHAHYQPAGTEEIAARDRAASNIVGDLFNLDVRLKYMDQVGVDVHLLSVPPWLLNPDPAVARRLNTGIAETVSHHPRRFAGLATVPMQEPEEAARELERAVKELKLRGVELCTNVRGANLDDRRFAPFYRKMQELDVGAFIHPHNVLGQDRLAPYYMTNFIGNPTDTAVAAACLIFGGVLAELPRLRFVLAHAGGSCPYLRGRWEHGWRMGVEKQRNLTRPPSEYFKLLYFDSLAHWTPALAFLVQTVGAERVLLGTDYPFVMGDPDPVRTVSSLPNLSDKEKDAIFGGNAVELFGLEV
jgi:aminocarboxymuconate-semialdehyde decarboxylase